MEDGGGAQSNRSSLAKSRVRFPTTKARDVVKGARVGVTSELTTWHDFVEPRKSSAFVYAKFVVLVFILPLLLVAIILFYSGNPLLRDTEASISWVCLFILRNFVTFSLAKFTEVVIIDYLSLRRRFTVKVSCNSLDDFLATIFRVSPFSLFEL